MTQRLNSVERHILQPELQWGSVNFNITNALEQKVYWSLNEQVRDRILRVRLFTRDNMRHNNIYASL